MKKEAMSCECGGTVLVGAPEMPVTLLTATLVLAWIACLELLVALGWAVQLPLLRVAPWMALLVVGGTVFAIARSLSPEWRGARIAAAAGVAICLTSMVLASVVHDFSNDGQTYHQQAILALADGWNPFRVHETGGRHSIWVSHYAKGPWIVSASCLALLSNVETGKAFTLILAVCCGLVAYTVLRTLHGAAHRFAAFASALAAANPVTCSQLWGYYIDGQVSSIVTIVALLTYLLAMRPSRCAAVALGAAIVIGVNIKFSVFPFIAVIFACMGLHLLWSRNLEAFSRLARPTVSGMALAMLVGFNPYVVPGRKCPFSRKMRWSPLARLGGSPQNIVDLVSLSRLTTVERQEHAFGINDERAERRIVRLAVVGGVRLLGFGSQAPGLSCGRSAHEPRLPGDGYCAPERPAPHSV